MYEQGVSVFRLSDPSTNRKFNLDGEINEVALVQFAFTPKVTDDAECVSSTTKEKITAQSWNQRALLGVRSCVKVWSRHGLPPKYAAIEDSNQHGALIVEWPEGQRFTSGVAPFGYRVIGRLGVEISGVHTVEPINNVVCGYVAPIPTAEPDTKKAKAKKAKKEKAEGEEEVDPNAIICYNGDPFIVTKDGHYMDLKELDKPEDKRFMVPRNFIEFLEQTPKYITQWVKKRLGKFVVDADVEDWVGDLQIHLGWLPETSKHREFGKTDVVETFDPYKLYGANQARFRSYINNCLANKMMTGQLKYGKEPTRRPDTVSLTSEEPSEDADYCGEITAEYVYANSEFLTKETARVEKNDEDRFFTERFKDFVNQEDPSMAPVVTALMANRTQKQAREHYTELTNIQISESEFTRLRNRLKQVAACFVGGKPVPEQRPPYGKNVVGKISEIRGTIDTPEVKKIMAATATALTDFDEYIFEVSNANFALLPGDSTRYSVFGFVPFETAQTLSFDNKFPWANPRLAYEIGTKKSGMAKEIAYSAENDPLNFLNNNGGAVIVADSAELLEDGKIRLKIAKNAMRGLVDGGTTVQTLADVTINNPNLVGFFRYEVRCGNFTNQQVVQMAQKLNTRKEVDKHSLANHRGSFNDLRAILEKGKVGYAPLPKISYSQGDKGKVKIDDVLQYVCTVMMDNPVPAYNNKAESITFVESFEGKNECARYGSMLIDILHLSESIQVKLGELYFDKLKNSGAVKKTAFKKKAATLPMTGKQSLFVTDNHALLLPLLSAFRGAIDQTKMAWSVRPELIIERIGGELLDTILETYMATKKWTNVGKDRNMYKQLTSQVELFVLRQGKA